MDLMYSDLLRRMNGQHYNSCLEFLKTQDSDKIIIAPVKVFIDDDAGGDVLSLSVDDVGRYTVTTEKVNYDEWIKLFLRKQAKAASLARVTSTSAQITFFIS